MPAVNYIRVYYFINVDNFHKLFPESVYLIENFSPYSSLNNLAKAGIHIQFDVYILQCIYVKSTQKLEHDFHKKTLKLIKS